MDIEPAMDFLFRNGFRNGRGYEIDLTPDEERKFEDYLRHVHGKYALGRYNNCGAPVVLGLKEIGHDLGGGPLDFLPSDLLDLLKGASGAHGPLIKGSVDYVKH